MKATVTLLKKKTLKYRATNTESIDRIARGHKNFLKIKLISKEMAKDTFI